MSTPPQILCGVVVSAGKMMRAVKVRTAKQTYNRFLKKQFLTYQNHLVSDPNSSLCAGDVVKIARDRRISRHIQHVVTEIVAPWGPRIEERPPVMSGEERAAKWQARKEAKIERKRIRETASEGEEGFEGVVEGTTVAS